MNDYTSEEIKNILESGDFDKFISQKESEILEVKKNKPYDLSQKPQKKAIMEFTKDVSSLANNKGGYIICGLKTEKPPTSPHDYIKEFDFINNGYFYKEEQLNGIVSSNIFPKLDIKVKWYPYKNDGNAGLGVIQIPEQDESKKYFIMKINEVDGEKTTREYFGIPIRTGDITIWFTVEKLYKLSKRSPNNFQELNQSLSAQLDEIKEMILSISGVPDTDSLQEKIEETIHGNK
ncbi:MAG: RNA-binding domain-containing protein [Candidatus Humimicrobiaceae bacterium]